MQYQITIPVLDEEQRLSHGIGTIMAFLEDQNLLDTWSIVIADNGSSDRTPDISRAIVQRFSEHVHYLRISAKGVGLAIRESWGQSSADIVGYMDVDLATDLAHLHDVVSLFQAHHVHGVNGSRLLPHSQVIGRSSAREISSRGLNQILKLVLDVQFSDAMCGFKFFRRTIALELLATIPVIPDWFVAAELLVRAEWSGYSIAEVPVTWVDDSHSKANIGKLTKQYLGHIYRLRKEKSRLL